MFVHKFAICLIVVNVSTVLISFLVNLFHQEQCNRLLPRTGLATLSSQKGRRLYKPHLPAWKMKSSLIADWRLFITYERLSEKPAEQSKPLLYRAKSAFMTT